jgi:hypothetical protein
VLGNSQSWPIIDKHYEEQLKIRIRDYNKICKLRNVSRHYYTGNNNDDDNSILYFNVLTHQLSFCLSFFLSVSVSSQCAGSEVKPLPEDRGCDSVLLGQSDRTPHGAMIDEYGAMVELYLQGKPKYSEKTCAVPLCPPQIPHGLTRARTRASAVRGQRLTA